MSKHTQAVRDLENQLTVFWALGHDHAATVRYAPGSHRWPLGRTPDHEAPAVHTAVLRPGDSLVCASGLWRAVGSTAVDSTVRTCRDLSGPLLLEVGCLFLRGPFPLPFIDLLTAFCLELPLPCLDLSLPAFSHNPCTALQVPPLVLADAAGEPDGDREPGRRAVDAAGHQQVQSWLAAAISPMDNPYG